MPSRRSKIISALAATGILIIAIVITIMQLEKPLAVADINAPKKPGVVYELKWDQTPRPEWSIHSASMTKKGHQRFVGPFNEKPLDFSIGGLPLHQFIRVRFDLITINPWNGDSQNFGRDLWDMRVANGQPLIHTTFSNCGFFNNNNEQSFPDQYPWYPAHPGWTGAIAQQSLGYTNNWGDGPQGVDSTYNFDLTFPHTAPTLKLEFKSQIKRHENKVYGFLNFKVETADHAADASEEKLAGWFKDLADEDPIKGYRAAWSLVAAGDAATSYIQSHLPKEAKAVVNDLNIDQETLWEYGAFQFDSPIQRQIARELHVLEAIGTPASKKILQDIGYNGTPQGGPPTHWD